MDCLYKDAVSNFVKLAKDRSIAEILTNKFTLKYEVVPSPQEITSWNNSLFALASVLETSRLDDCYIILEFQMPLSSTRCDVLLVGMDKSGILNGLIVELKQWQYVAVSTVKDAVAIAGKNYNHPSIQARSYANFLKYFNEAFTGKGIEISSVSYLHNMVDKKSIQTLKDLDRFGALLRNSPAYVAGEEQLLINKLNQKLAGGNGEKVAQLILDAKIRPSTKLLDVVAEAVKSNFEWNLLDEQITVFNTIVSKVEEAKLTNEKSLIIVRGGPGTGKSVLAIQLLAYAAQNHWSTAHATGSKAFITVLQGKTQEFADNFLMRIHNVQTKKQLPVKDLFSTFAKVAELGSRTDGDLDLVVGDEAHRLWDFRRNKFANMNKQLSTTPMIEELLRASKVTALFLDDNQAVRADEIGSVQYFEQQATRLGVNFELIDLNVQFRCSGSQSYIEWIDYSLNFTSIKSLAWKQWDGYDFQIMDSMTDLQSKLDSLKSDGNKCRLLAGFNWKWSEIQGNGGLIYDLQDPRFGQWKGAWIEKGAQDAAPLDSRYYKWATDDSYYSQIGSIYSVQGFEFDYIGLIFGEDLVWRNGNWVADIKKNKDNTFKKDLSSTGLDPLEKLRNIYRVLLTRGMKGSFVYFLDPETKTHFESLLRQ